MSASPGRKSVVVGLFVTVGLVLLGGGVLAIGDINDTFTRKIGVSAVFDEVGGLDDGDNVWFSGVKVGVVKEIGFHDGSQVEVRMSIDRSAAQYIANDTLAKIGADGLIGNKIVILYEGTPAAPRITDGTVLAVGEALSMDEVMATAQENNQNLLAITNDLKTLTGRIAAGEGTAGKLLKDDDLYTSIDATLASLESASERANHMPGSLSAFAADLNREGNFAHDLATDTEIVPSLRTTATQASALVDGIARSTSDPNTAVGTLLHDQEAGSDIKGMLDNLNGSTRLLAEDLEAAQHNFLLRGFFKKKEKAARKAGAQERIEAPVPAPAEEEEPPRTGGPASR
jgi:phospholipid/cholesterol/gamma-HCH transport system substrate-binding protein